MASVTGPPYSTGWQVRDGGSARMSGLLARACAEAALRTRDVTMLPQYVLALYRSRPIDWPDFYGTFYGLEGCVLEINRRYPSRYLSKIRASNPGLLKLLLKGGGRAQRASPSGTRDDWFARLDTEKLQEANTRACNQNKYQATRMGRAGIHE